MSAVDPEVPIESENPASRMDLGQPDQAGISQGHGAISVSMHQFTKIRDLILHFQSDPQHATLQKHEQGVGLAAFALQEESGLRENRLTGQQRGRPSLPLSADPIMVIRTAGEKGHKWAGIEQNRTVRFH
jgi:hypothetical protein